MAIDDAEKRRSASGVPFLPLGPGVTPNAAPDVDWRQQAGWSYSGVLVTGESPPSPGGGGGDWLIIFRRRRRRS